jgi:predicted Zn-dependent peptidase
MAPLDMYQVTRLPGGLTVATAEMPHMASASLGLWVGVGGRYEPAPLNGVSHFIEHMLFKGTRKRSAKEISQAVEGIGGYLNAFTGEESTCFYSKARHDRFDELLEVLADMFLNSKFDPVEIEKERAVIKEELAMYLDQPQHQVQELLNETLWPDQPLGRPLTGTGKTLDALARADLVGFQRSNYVSGATLIAAAGNLSHKRVVRSVARFASRFPAGRPPRFSPARINQSGPRLRLFTKKTEQTQLALGLRTCSRHDERRFALRLLNTILGENMSSRLFQVVREDRGLAYNIYSSLSFFDDTGDLVISAGLDTAKVTETLKLILRELRRLRDRPPAATELRRARDYVIGQIDLSLENTESQMMWLGEQLLAYGKIIPAHEIKSRLSRVTAAEIRAAAHDFVRPERLNLALVSSRKSAAGFKNLLRM